MCYSINLHFNKVFKGNATTVKGQLLSLRDIYKGMPIFDMKALFYQENIIRPSPTRAVSIADSQKHPQRLSSARC